VPKNTVSRWETGATTPDADSLAAIYSIAREAGVVANFFAADRTAVPIRDIALVYWDGSAPLSGAVNHAQNIVEAVRAQMPRSRRPLLKSLAAFPAYVSTELQSRGWRGAQTSSIIGSLFGNYNDCIDRIYEQALSDAGQNPTRSAVFLAVDNTVSREYVDLVRDLHERGVLVHVICSKSAWVFYVPRETNPLIAAVGERRVIEVP
jgi:transcriptional regulator with XRE-family HTH domain